ncbi:hypothetical protein RB614_36335 [Phytohabitans sp. ZYX-F-186]|uniref:Uncharacterized protein n=1 Tax=Phytohabitans maris TaxID=3071409 RepID=A0ABU0ZT60_9ACTN|nr:hypothetical protein [Phytohabitans sp. ZYX-F-186]MDQ7909981.1 hypothetical protein [Phytohabitans sp. ZYX-F-186]
MEGVDVADLAGHLPHRHAGGEAGEGGVLDEVDRIYDDAGLGW